MPRYCHPIVIDLDCELCRRYESDSPRGYRTEHDLIDGELKRIRREEAKKKAGLATPVSEDQQKRNRRAEPCKFRLGLVATIDNRQWVGCDHPDHPIKSVEFPDGSAVCGCMGCGPGCSGYAVKPSESG